MDESVSQSSNWLDSPVERSIDISDHWMSALRLLKPCIPASDLKRLVLNTSLVTGDRWDLTPIQWFMREGGQLLLRVHPEVLERWWKPEQLEVFAFAAAMTHLWLSQGLQWNRLRVTESQKSLAKLVGCVCSDSLSPSERWRQMGVQGVDPTFLLSVEPFPATCKICNRYVNSDEPRADVHANCLLYARTVLAPQLAAYEDAQRTIAAEELDA